MSSSIEQYANRNPTSKAWSHEDESPIGEGKYKFVLDGMYDGGCIRAALKFLKSGTTFSSDCFADDVRAAEAALPYISGFHQYLAQTSFRGRVSIKINIPAVWGQTDGRLKGQKILVEPFIREFQKFNSNSGAADATATVAQALSHYSYHASDGTELMCDLQGGRLDDSYVLSDVVIMSMGKKYGPTDLGATGIENWLNAHQCNRLCCSSWKKWCGAKCLIEPVFSTTMTLDVVTAPAVGQVFRRVRPSSIMFTQDSIKNLFQDGHTLLETALQIARKDIDKRDIQMISVVEDEYQGSLFALDNRRLAVFRLLEICGRVGTIKVEVVPFIRWIGEWCSKKTTTCEGAYVKIRAGNYRIGRNGHEQETQVPSYWLDQVRYAQNDPQAPFMSNAEFGPFLANFTDE